VWILVGAILALSVGIALGLYLVIRATSSTALIGVVLLALSGIAMASFDFLWGWHEFLGFRFVLNEYQVPAIVGLLLFLGWVFVLLGLLRAWRR